MPRRNIYAMTEQQRELHSRVDECLKICRVERKGIYARDVDLMLSVERRLSTYRDPTARQRARLDEVMARVLASSPKHD